MKIFIYGHRHTGTTILRKIIGSHSKIYDYLDETDIPPDLSYENIVFKLPTLPSELQDQCKRIMIIKNPYDVFGSIRLRFGSMSVKSYKKLIEEYEKFVLHFLKTDDLKIKYEDMFHEPNMIKLFNDLGFGYEGIKNTKGYISSVHMYIPENPPEDQTDGENHANYRQWQINQPFQNMTGKSAKYCECIDLIKKSEIINKLYGNFSYSG